MNKKLVGVIGWPVAHSLSPVMHNRAFLHLSLRDWLYLPLPVPSERVQDAVLGLRALGFRGANVTVPHKEAVMPYLDKLSDTAKAMGAVNTIVIDDGGALVGHNTDGVGFLLDLNEHNVALAQARVLVLGAGGAARAIVHALSASGCREIIIVNRTKSRADELARAVSDSAITTGTMSAEFIKQLPRCDVVINTTSVGLNSDDMPWDESMPFVPEQFVYDLIYNPQQTKLMRYAKHCGAKTANGVGMLVHQGAKAFELWTGHEAPVEIMRRAVRDALP